MLGTELHLYTRLLFGIQPWGLGKSICIMHWFTMITKRCGAITKLSGLQPAAWHSGRVVADRVLTVSVRLSFLLPGLSRTEETR
jgi:hypothetical protein